MDGYLLDNNVISVAGRKSDARHANVAKLLTEIASSPVFLPIIAVAEIEFGMAKVPRPDPDPLADELRAFFRIYDVLPFDESSVQPYSLLRAQLWKEHGTSKKNKKGHEEKWVEELPFVKALGADMKVDERDVQIVSMSMQYNLILATNDSNEGMRRIDEAGRPLARQWRDPLVLHRILGFPQGHPRQMRRPTLNSPNI